MGIVVPCRAMRLKALQGSFIIVVRKIVLGLVFFLENCVSDARNKLLDRAVILRHYGRALASGRAQAGRRFELFIGFYCNPFESQPIYSPSFSM